MELISKLNRAARRWILPPIPFALCIALSVVLLWQQLAALYARPVDALTTSVRPARREDSELFERVLAAGLLRPGGDGTITIAPADLPLRQAYARAHPELLAPGDGEFDWLRGPWDDAIRELHRALHFSASGRYLRRQVETFNARQLLASVRWRPDSDLSGDWRADWDGAPLMLTTAMPLLAGRFFTETPVGWQPWRRVARWPALAGRPPVRFRLSLARPARRGERLELLVVGEAPRVTGATLRASAPRCLEDVQPCAEAAAVAHWLRLEWREGATHLDLSLRPLSAAALPDLYRYDFAHIQREDGRLVWHDSPPAGGADAVRSAAAEVTLRDRQGTVLLERGQPTETAWALGLAALVGLDAAHGGAVGGVLARLGGRGIAAVDARLTVENRLQAAARRALLEQMSRVETARGDGADSQREAQAASLLALDADRGDILAVVDSPEPPPGAAWSDLHAFAAAWPRRSPLSIRAWRRDGGEPLPAGGAFELVDALLLEPEARHRPDDSSAPLGAQSLLDVAAALGFGVTRDLDGGLLPAGLIETGDALRTTASTLDPITNQEQARLAALGLRMRITPLQLAEAAAAIATGRRAPPKLLAELNGRPAINPAGSELGIPTNRIRQGMQWVVTVGAARAVFADSIFDPIRPHLYLKMGASHPDPTGITRNAWLVGWLEPGALPGENRRLAFVCLISPAADANGEECGSVVATWLAALRRAESRN